MLEVSNRLSSAAAGGNSGTAGEASPPFAAGFLSRLVNRRLTPAPASGVYNIICQRPAASGQRPELRPAFPARFLPA